jgi:saxitoxin biosynthesis operon SxtJ-like protein
LHEDLKRQHDVKAGSERGCGFVFAGFFFFLAFWPLVAGGAVRAWSVAVAAAFLAIALLRPALLAPLNRVWLKLGMLLHRVVSPVVLGVLFYLVVAPTGLLMRALGKDPLRLRLDRASDSYWLERRPPGPAPETMRNQF